MPVPHSPYTPIVNGVLSTSALDIRLTTGATIRLNPSKSTVVGVSESGFPFRCGTPLRGLVLMVSSESMTQSSPDAAAQRKQRPQPDQKVLDHEIEPDQMGLLQGWAARITKQCPSLAIGPEPLFSLPGAPTNYT